MFGSYPVKIKNKINDLPKKKIALNFFLISYSLALIYILSRLISNWGINNLPPIAFFVLFIIFLILFLFLRVSFLSLSNYVFIGLFFALTTYIVYEWGVNLPIGLLFYVLIIIISNILISARFSLAITGISSLTVFIIGYFQLNNIIRPDIEWMNKPLEAPDIFIYPAIFSMVSALSYFSGYRADKLLAGAKKRELEFENRNFLLEEKTKKIIEEIENGQARKTSELYRFAEFGRLSSGIFHDLINPLSAISLNMEKIKEMEGSRPDEIKPYLDRAVSATSRMENFIIALKKQISKKKEKSIFYLKEEIEQAVEILLYKAQKNGVEIKICFDKDLSLFGDATKFNQLIINLIVNGLDSYDYSKECLDIRKEVIISFFEKENNIILTVKDFGCGIEEEKKKNIFNPFFTTKKESGGIGLGLFLVKDIVEKEFNGKIGVKSFLNKGSEFIVFLPKNKI